MNTTTNTSTSNTNDTTSAATIGATGTSRRAPGTRVRQRGSAIPAWYLGRPREVWIAAARPAPSTLELAA